MIKWIIYKAGEVSEEDTILLFTQKEMDDFIKGGGGVDGYRFFEIKQEYKLCKTFHLEPQEDE